LLFLLPVLAVSLLDNVFTPPGAQKTLPTPLEFLSALNSSNQFGAPCGMVRG